MRPEDLDDLHGQEEVTDGFWRKLLDKNSLPSLILWGPPGCGKTSLANVIANRCRRDESMQRFVKLSACSAGVADVREAVRAAQSEMRLLRRRTVLFIDEVHRFNKAQQDAFLPHVESGAITLLGATTENPSFSLNAALLSRCKVIVMRKLSPEAVCQILVRAAKEYETKVDGDALTYLSNVADGDARTALNCLQIALDSAKSGEKVSVEAIKQALSRSHVLYDRKGDEHYHCASALQKSIRGSDDNAALYWCMRMLQGGEDPLFVARRLVRISSEDVGLGDPAALPMAVAAMQACQLIGKPECNVVLAQCCVYLARAKKSHEVNNAMESVLREIQEGNLPPVPIHLRNVPTKLTKELGYGKGYSYDLDDVGRIKYLPKELENKNFFT